MGKRKPIFKAGHYIVVRCFNDTDKYTYYTVVNTMLKIHRHTRDETAAVMLCKYAHKLTILERFDTWFKNDLRYLIFGDVKYK